MKWLLEMARKLGRLFDPPSKPTEGQCGAVALRFAYKRLGKRASLDDIWTHVKTPKEALGPGALTSSGHLMCRDALSRGFLAIYFESKYERGLALLEEARKRNVEVILLHATPDPAWRHYSVFEGMDGGNADVFDPSGQGLVSMTREELLEMWGGMSDNGSGHCLLTLSKAPPEAAECASCGLPIPAEVRCHEPNCRNSVPIGPGSLLGCVSRDCPEATWEWVMCPFCGTPIDDLRAWSAW